MQYNYFEHVGLKIQGFEIQGFKPMTEHTCLSFDCQPRSYIFCMLINKINKGIQIPKMLGNRLLTVRITKDLRTVIGILKGARLRR